MQKLKISEDLSLPIDAATQTFAFIARKGAGKTYAAGKLAECMMGRVRDYSIKSIGWLDEKRRRETCCRQQRSSASRISRT